MTCGSGRVRRKGEAEEEGNGANAEKEVGGTFGTWFSSSRRVLVQQMQKARNRMQQESLFLQSGGWSFVRLGVYLGTWRDFRSRAKAPRSSVSGSVRRLESQGERTHCLLSPSPVSTQLVTAGIQRGGTAYDG